MVIIYFSGALLIAAGIFFIRNKRLNYLLLGSYPFWLALFNIYQAVNPETVQYRFFKADSLGIIFLTLLTIISFATVFHSILYQETRTDHPRILAIHHAALVLFLTMISGVILANHAGVLWAFLEATTLTGSVLIFHHRDPLTLEATWKYVFVCSIGIALAFGGILFLGIASQAAETPGLFFSQLRETAPAMEPVWLQLSFLLILSGFSVKMSLVPLFNVDIDAKDVSPTPVGGLFSSALMNAGFIAIFRFYECFSGSSIYPWMNRLLMLTGTLSIFFAAVYILKVKNFKRMFAYSSLEHAGIVLIALSAGGVGRYAAIFHLILHALVKSSLFFQLGQVYRVFRSKRVGDTGDYFKLNPWGGTVMLGGFFCITAMPPGGMFISEFLAFKAFIQSGHLWLAAACFILLLFIIWRLSLNFFQLLFAAHTGRLPGHSQVRPYESAFQLIFISAVIALGVHVPEFLNNLILKAIQYLP